MNSGCDGCRVLPQEGREQCEEASRSPRSSRAGALMLTACSGGGGGGGEDGDLEASRRHHDLVLQQRGRDRVGQADGRGVERRPPRRAGQGAGDPGGQQQRGGHRRRDHRGQRTVPDLQHLARGRAAVREGGRPRVAVELRGRRRLHRRAQRRQRGAVRVGGRRVLPDALEVQPRHDLLQQGHVHRGGPRPGGARAVDLRRVPRHVAHADRVGRRAVRDLPRPVERVLPVVVRLLPALRG